jgi:hypothetical protein
MGCEMSGTEPVGSVLPPSATPCQTTEYGPGSCFGIVTENPRLARKKDFIGDNSLATGHAAQIGAAGEPR